MMKPYNLQLKNNELNCIVGQCFFYLPEYNSTISEDINERFAVAADEFDWSSDMSYLNCYDILYSALLEIKEETPAYFKEIMFLGDVPNMFLYNKLRITETLPHDETVAVITFKKDVRIENQKEFIVCVTNPEGQI